MDFSNLTNDELADAGKDFVDELHARAEGLPNRYRRRVNALHAFLYGLKGDAVEDELIQPMSGGGDKGQP